MAVSPRPEPASGSGAARRRDSPARDETWSSASAHRRFFSPIPFIDQLSGWRDWVRC